MSARVEDAGPSPRDEAMPPIGYGPAVTRVGDVILLGKHRLHVGDSRDSQSYVAVLGDERAALMISDAPYNVKIQGHVSGSARGGRQ